MKLRDLDIIITAPPAPGWGGRYWILVKLTTDCGITGWGECYASSIGPQAMVPVIPHKKSFICLKFEPLNR